VTDNPIDATAQAENIAALEATGACVMGDWGESEACISGEIK
jgi:hypothetical protein